MLINKLLIAAVAITLVPLAAMAAEIEDGESATHGSEAAQYQEVETYKYPGFQIVQYDLATLSHFSYMLTSNGEALVVDPGRNIATYLKAAQDRGVKITAVWLTHSHADFVAGQIELASALEVPIYVSRHAGAEYEHMPLKVLDKTAGPLAKPFDRICISISDAVGSPLKRHFQRRLPYGIANGMRGHEENELGMGIGAVMCLDGDWHRHTSCRG